MTTATAAPPADPPADPFAWSHADIIQLLGDHDAPAPRRPADPPEPTRSRAEQGDLIVGQLNALGYAAQSEHVRLSALYRLGCAYGYEYTGDRILDLAQHARSEHVQLSALHVAARGLGLLKPLRSLVPDADPNDFEVRVVRVFPGTLEELDDLNRCLLPDPPGPPSPLDLERYLYNLQYAYSPHTEQVPDIAELTAELAAEYAAKHGEAQATREAVERAARYAADPDGNPPPNPYHPAYAKVRLQPNPAADTAAGANDQAATQANANANANADTPRNKSRNPFAPRPYGSSTDAPRDPFDPFTTAPFDPFDPFVTAPYDPSNPFDPLNDPAPKRPPSPRNPLPRLPTPRLPRPIRIAKVDTPLKPARPIPTPQPAPAAGKTPNTKPVPPVRQKVLEAYEQARQAHRRRQNQPPTPQEKAPNPPPTAGGDSPKSPPTARGDGPKSPPRMGGDLEGGAPPRPPP